MPFYLHVCQDQQNDKFLLLSEQQLDGSLPEIKAQIYFNHPATNLEKEEIKVASYGVSKKEIEEVLNFAQQRNNVSNHSTGLFTQGKIDKKNPFKIFSYPSVKDIIDILDLLHVSMPSEADYCSRTVKPDLDHILDDKHRIYWQQQVPLSARKKIDQHKWLQLEADEIEVLNKLNVIDLVLNENLD